MIRNIRGSKILLIAITLGMASLAYALSVGYLKEKEAVLTDVLTTQYNQQVAILVANSTLAPGSFVTEDLLAVMEIPMQFLPTDALYPDDFDTIRGLEIRWPVGAGKPLLKSYLGQQVAARFSDTIPMGFRAITLSVNAMNSHENMIEVGDKVDLFKVIDTDMTLLQEQVRVIATGNVRSASTDPNGALIGGDDSLNDYQSMTLLLLTEQIAQVRLAEQSQELLVLLRNPKDLASVSTADHTGLPTETQVPFLSNKQAQGFLPLSADVQAKGVRK